MLSLHRVSTGQASTYYSEDDYYLETGGEWYGKAAEDLELMGKIDEEDFKKLVQGEAPKGQFKIQGGGKDFDHTAGVDLTFSAPKSVSIAGLILDDQRIFEAHKQAVNATLEYIENNLVSVRLKKKGKVLTEKTNNIAVAKFQHIASRELDPQLHTHCLVMNASKKDNGKWRAVDYYKIFKNKKMLGQLYRTSLAQNLQNLGYQIEADNKGMFELKCFDDNLLKQFSQRSEQIKQRVEELKKEFPSVGESKLKAMATLDTRKRKDEPSVSELKEEWDIRFKEYGFSKNLLKEELLKQLKSIPKEKQTIENIIESAVNIHIANQAVIPKEDILSTAMRLNMQDYSISEYEAALLNNKNLQSYNNNQFFTTKEIADIEINIVKQIREQQNTVQSLLEIDDIELGISSYELMKGFKLTKDQKNAVKHILNSKDKAIAIQGDAGTGKTTMLDCINYIVNADKINIKVHGLSFTGKAAYEIQEASGIESDTVARFIHSQKGINSEPAMYVVDEASMLSIKDMDSLMNRIDNNARLVLIGDVKQLQSIGAGKIFSTLQSEKAINTVVMSESKRQVEQLYKKSVQKMAEKITSEAFNLLDKSGKILEIKDRDERLMLIANKYCERHKDTILVTATNRDCQELNNIIRWKLQKEGKIGTGDIGLIMREQKTIIEEQRFFYQSYNINDLVVVNTDILGKAGLEGNITYIDKKSNSITIKDKNNNNYDINLSKDGADLSVYTEKLKQFTHGDKIVFLKNDKGLGISNGQTATIQEIDCNGKAKLTLDNGKTQTINLSKQYKYVAHGYALTDYKAQGQTAKVVIYHADTYNVVNFNQAYVGITRGKEDIAIFTDDKVMFKEMIEKEQEKTTIHEFERNEKKLRIKNKADYNKPNITQKYNNF